jgi:hypothetical protein
MLLIIERTLPPAMAASMAVVRQPGLTPSVASQAKSCTKTTHIGQKAYLQGLQGLFA